MVAAAEGRCAPSEAPALIDLKVGLRAASSNGDTLQTHLVFGEPDAVSVWRSR